MRASTLLLLTFIIWITGKGRLSKYWELATTDTVAPSGADGGPGSDLSHASILPGFSLNGVLGDFSKWLNDNYGGKSGGGGW